MSEGIRTRGAWRISLSMVGMALGAALLGSAVAAPAQAAVANYTVNSVPKTASGNLANFDRHDVGANQEWIPQGLTNNGKFFVTSWYQRNKSTKAVFASRITISARSGDNYRHVRLLTAGGAQVKEHVGGVALVKNKLYVAVTSKILIFDTNKIHKSGSRYVLNQTGSKDVAGFRFSTVGVSKDGKRLLAAEYRESGQAQIVSWGVTATGGLSGSPVKFKASVLYIQGVTTNGSSYLVSRSAGVGAAANGAGNLSKLADSPQGWRLTKVKTIDPKPQGLTWMGSAHPPSPCPHLPLPLTVIPFLPQGVRLHHLASPDPGIVCSTKAC